MIRTHTHTYAILPVPHSVFDSVKAELEGRGVLADYFDKENQLLVLGTIALQAKPASGLTESQRLKEIAGVIEGVENRCMANDGPVGKTSHEITEQDLKRIYRLAMGKEGRHKTAQKAQGFVRP